MQTLAMRLSGIGFFGGSNQESLMMQTRPKNIHTQLLDTLGERIVSGQYPQGAKLPLENDFCTEFGISRPAMREVMRVLASKGLVVSKPKIGTLVRPKKEWNLLDKDVLGWIINTALEGQFFEDLFEVRLALEPEVCAIAAQCATADDLLLIKEAYVTMEAATSREEMLVPDLLFHQAIIAATHNELLEFIGNTLLVALAASIKVTSRTPHSRNSCIALHEAVYRAITAREPEVAREAARVLVMSAREDFEKMRTNLES